MIVMGVDPGLVATGWVALAGDPLAIVGCGTIKTNSSDKLPHRLNTLHEELSAAIAHHKPQAAAVEGLFYRPGLAKTALLLGHARGALLLALEQAGVPLHEYAASEVRKALGVSGKADKLRTHRMVEAILGAAAPGSDHVWDAAALALCHIMRLGHQGMGGRE